MAMFEVKITETRICTVTVEAETAEEARDKVEQDYFAHANDYLLEPDDTEFETIKEEEE